MNIKRCDKCEWWARNKNKPREEHDDDCPFDYHQDLDETLGQCRFNPPIVGIGEYYTLFPVTREDCWCGKFKKERGEE